MLSLSSPSGSFLPPSAPPLASPLSPSLNLGSYSSLCSAFILCSISAPPSIHLSSTVCLNCEPCLYISLSCFCLGQAGSCCWFSASPCCRVCVSPDVLPPSSFSLDCTFCPRSCLAQALFVSSLWYRLCAVSVWRLGSVTCSCERRPWSYC